MKHKKIKKIEDTFLVLRSLFVGFSLTSMIFVGSTAYNQGYKGLSAIFLAIGFLMISILNIAVLEGQRKLARRSK